MVQKDYMVRIIEQLATFLWSILFNKKIRNYEYALGEIEKAYNGLLHIDGDRIKNLELDDIIKNNTNGNGLNIDNIEIIATLLFEEADILEQLNGINIISGTYYQKSFALFYQIYQKTKTKKHIKNIEEIIVKINNYIVTDETKYNLFRYCEENKLFGKAEDYLYDLIENKYTNIIKEGKEFYLRLLENEDDILEKGNLPRNEIIDGINYLENNKE
jgi:hypothetical protein